MAGRRRWYRSWKSVITLSCSSVVLTIYFFLLGTDPERAARLADMEEKFEEALKIEKGLSCEIPELGPFAIEDTNYDENLLKIECSGVDWVKCYHSSCRVVDGISETVNDIKCEYRDILYQNDVKYALGPVTLSDDGDYELVESDHAKVSCSGTQIYDNKQLKWSGNVIGFRSSVKVSSTQGDSLNVMVLAFETMSRHGFIRHMPKSWKVITEELGAVVMEGYSVLGDTTLAALYPLITGRTEHELRDDGEDGDSMDSLPLIFHKLKEEGYRTAFFEDRPDGASEYNLHGFRQQPTDHYLRAFSMAEANASRPHCVGDTPQYTLMLNLTEQFLDLGGKRFVFTLISDITRDVSRVHAADDVTADMLRRFRGHGEDTMLVLVGAHGPRVSEDSSTLLAKLEERLPFLTLLVPSRMVDKRPDMTAALRDNARTLTTPHDLHTTILDVLNMIENANPFKVEGVDLERGLTLLEPIPQNRSCREADIHPRWCACLPWQTVHYNDPLFDAAAHALLDFINALLSNVSFKCARRTLLSTEWIFRQVPNSHLLSAGEGGFFRRYSASSAATEKFLVKVLVGPGQAVFEASLAYAPNKGRFLIRTSDISRINAYGNEPDCIRDTHSYLNYYCYCKV